MSSNPALEHHEADSNRNFSNATRSINVIVIFSYLPTDSHSLAGKCIRSEVETAKPPGVTTAALPRPPYVPLNDMCGMSKLAAKWLISPSHPVLGAERAVPSPTHKA